MTYSENTVVGVYINKINRTFLIKLIFHTSFFQITSLQVNKWRLLVDTPNYFFSLSLIIFREFFRLQITYIAKF